MLGFSDDANRRGGFSFIELVVVAGVLVVLLSILFIAVNPSRQYEVALDQQRERDVRMLLRGLQEWHAKTAADISVLNEGNGIPVNPTAIGSGEGEVNLCRDLVPEFLADIPFDPTRTPAHFLSCDDYATGYTIVASTGPVTTLIISSTESGYADGVELQ